MNYQTEQNVAVSLKGNYYLFPDRASFNEYVRAKALREDVKSSFYGATPLADIIVFSTTKYEDFAA